MIPVAKPYLPSRQRIDRYVDRIYSGARLTNFGPLARELTQRLEDYCGVSNLLLTSSGTLALQVAVQALGVAARDGRPGATAVTTPFTFAATAHALRWEGLSVRFADVRPGRLTLCPLAARESIRDDTTVLVPVHVYGNPCDLDEFDQLSESAGIPLVYDAAHAFGVRVGAGSVLSRGDASAISFHATKVFHTCEGGAIVFRSRDALEAAREIVDFGRRAGEPCPVRPGINGKLSEVHAAFGLALLDEFDRVLSARREVVDCYDAHLPEELERPLRHENASDNAAYLPVLFADEASCLACQSALRESGYESRRYFWPSLAAGRQESDCPQASAAAARVLCLPLHADVAEADVRQICSVVERFCEH